MSALKVRDPRLIAFACVLALGSCIASASGAQASTYRVIYSFCGKANCTDGSSPQAALAMDGAHSRTSDTDSLPSGWAIPLAIADIPKTFRGEHEEYDKRLM